MEAKLRAPSLAIKSSQRGCKLCLIQPFNNQQPYRQQVTTSRPCGVEALIVQVDQRLITFCPLPAAHNLL